MLASPVLQIAKIASAVFFQTQSRVNAQAACKSKAFTFVFPCALYGVLTCSSCCRAPKLLFGSLFGSRSL